MSDFDVHAAIQRKYDWEVVWLSDELEPLAEMEQQRDAARAELDRAMKVVEPASAWVEFWRARDETMAIQGRRTAALIAAVDAFTPPADRCPQCGNGYRYGDEGCRHAPPLTLGGQVLADQPADEEGGGDGD